MTNTLFFVGKKKKKKILKPNLNYIVTTPFCVYNYLTLPIFYLTYSYFYNLLLPIFPPYKDYKLYYLPYICGISLLLPISL